MNRPSRDADLLETVRLRANFIAARIAPDASDCWMWVGGRTRNGYGSITIPDGQFYRSIRAHRAVFMLHHGRAIAAGMTLHHKCHMPACVNPSHLVELTQADNNAADATGGASIRFRPTSRGVPRWAVLFREGGKQRSRTFGSREDADAFASARVLARG